MAQQKKSWVRLLSDAINLATTVVAAVALGYFGGRWLDGKFDTEPWLSVAGFLLGIAAGIKAMWAKAMDNKKPTLPEKDTEDDKG